MELPVETSKSGREKGWRKNFLGFAVFLGLKPNESKAQCKVMLDTGVKSGAKLVRNPRTMEIHLFGVHKERSGEFSSAKDSARSQKASAAAKVAYDSKVQLSLTATFQNSSSSASGTSKYSSSHKKQQQFKKNLAFLVSGTSIPYTLLKSPWL